MTIIPPERRKRVFESLLADSVDLDARVVVDDVPDDELVLVGVAASDWPGLATVVLSELQHSGWNLDTLEGFTTELAGRRTGVVLAGITDPDNARREMFTRDAHRMEDLLRRLALGRAGTMSLLSRAAERFERFEEVRRHLEKAYGNEPVPPGILGEGGELVLFISSRSDEYLAERKPEDLAWIVKTNFNLVNRVRTSGGRAHFRLKNLRTTREHLTGINIAGYERDISFQNCVTALTHAWSGATIRHQRRYTTRDGIISIRIEMTGPAGLSAKKEEQAVIRRSLNRLLVAHELDKLNRIHRYGGAEHYARALIPLLLRECESTELSQAYIAMVSSTTFTASLKLILVTGSFDAESHDRKIIDLIGRINSNSGLTVVSFRSPSSFKKHMWVDILDISANREAYEEMEESYLDIKRSIEGSFGRFRDFDRGMRLNDVRQLKEIREQLSGLPDNMITDFYYRIEEFLRASISTDELAMHIRLAYESINRFMEEGRTQLPPEVRRVGGGERGVATLVCIVADSDSVSFQYLLETVREYTVNASIIEWAGANAYLLRIQEQGKGLAPQELERVLARLDRLSDSECRPRGS